MDSKLSRHKEDKIIFLMGGFGSKLFLKRAVECMNYNGSDEKTIFL